MTNNDTMVAVTPEARALFKALFVFSPDDALASDTIDRGLWDDDWRMKEIARHQSGRTGAGEADMLAFVRDCIEESRSDLVGYYESNKAEAADTSKHDAAMEWLAALSQSTAGEDRRRGDLA